MDQRTRRAFARHNDGTGIAAGERLLFVIEKEVALLFVRAVAGISVFRKDGLDLFVEIHGLCGGWRKFCNTHFRPHRLAHGREQQTASDRNEPARPKSCRA